MEVINRLKLARSLEGLTQAQLGSRVGMDHTNISHYESGRRLPEITSALKIAQALDTSVDKLWSLKKPVDPMNNQQSIVKFNRSGNKKGLRVSKQAPLTFSLNCNE